MKKLILFFIINLIISSKLLSQEAVISEIQHQNTTTSSVEWTEILIIQDNISLVGYSIRDNSGTDGWRGGVKFKDVDLWKNLREGTIIVVNHRGGVIDEDKSDGYIEIGAESSYYFDRFLPVGGGGDWTTAGSLDLNTSYDMIQLRNAMEQHVHCLGYIGGQIDENYDTIPKPNIFLNSGISNGHSVRVTPGLNLGNYNSGLSPANIYSSNNLITKGTPNRRNDGDYQNQMFWRELRQPDWTNPGVINTRIVDNFSAVELKWNAASTFSDPNEGYMILRYIDNTSIEPIIEDGKIYNVGQQIGPYKVIALLPRLSSNEYLDRFTDGEEFLCGTKYAYRIYAYRYRESTRESDRLDYDFRDPRFARGRQYNETSFASVAQSVVKEIPPVPVISSTINETRFCSNVDAKLEANIKDIQKYIYKWFSTTEGEVAGEGFTLKLTKPGRYYLELIDKSSGCSTTSNEILIEILQAPEAYIIESSTNRTFNRDTTIALCNNQSINLRGLSLPATGVTAKWIKDGVEVSTNLDLSINSPGKYNFISIAGGLCPDTSISVNVLQVNPEFVLSETLLEFDADNSPEKNLTITNNSTDPLIINLSDIIITPQNNFRVVAPTTFPIVIPTGSSATLTIRFEIVGFGQQNGRITINSVCNYSKFTDLRGERVNLGETRLDPDKADLDLGNRTSLCPDYDYGNTFIRFMSSGIDDLVVLKPTFSTNNFSFVSTDFETNNTIIIKPGGFFDGYVKVETAVPGVYSDEIEVKYVPVNRTDTSIVRVKVTLNLYDPSITVLTNQIDVSNEVTCKKTLDTIIIVRNETISDIVIKDDIINSQVSITETLPKTISAGSLDTIKVRINFTDKNNFTFNIKYENPCELLSSNVSVIPPQVDLDVVLSSDVVDFGIVNNCENNEDISEFVTITASAEGARIGRIIRIGNQITSNLYVGRELNQGENRIEIKLPSSFEGNISESFVFEVEPCGELYSISIKGKRVTPKDAVFSSLVSIDFGTDNIFSAGNRTFTVLNENEDLDIVIDSLIVPAPFELVSHSKADFPLPIQALGSVELIFEYKRLSVGNPVGLMNLFVSKPCRKKHEFVMSGSTTDNRRVKIIAKLPENETIEIGSEKRLPINVEFDPNYSLAEVDIRSMAFHLSFDYTNLNLRTANKGTAVTSQSSIVMYDDSQEGKLVLTINIPNSESISNGDIVLVTVKPLLGDALTGRINLDTVVIDSKMPTTVETNNSDITIIGDCDLEGRLLAVAGGVNITVRDMSDNASLRINYSTISDESTSISIYNYLGELVDMPINGHFKPGDHSIIYDTSKLSSGVYTFILKNGLRIESINYPVLK